MCSDTPRFSYVVPKTVICACPTGTRTSPAVCTAPADGLGGCLGGYGRVVYRVGNRCAIPGTQPPARGDTQTSEAGPGSPLGAGVGGSGGRANPGTAAGTVPTHPCGARSVLPWRPSLYRTLQIAASWPYTARFDLISYKVSQNGEVSPESVEKACHSPHIQKRVPKVTS